MKTMMLICAAALSLAAAPLSHAEKTCCNCCETGKCDCAECTCCDCSTCPACNK